MTKKQKEESIKMAINYGEELKMLVSSLCEDIKDSTSMSEAWKKIDRFYKDAESMRNNQKCTGSLSFSIMQEDISEGHTKYLQGLNLPIMVNSIQSENGDLLPSKTAEMHIDSIHGKQVLLITPEIISVN